MHTYNHLNPDNAKITVNQHSWLDLQQKKREMQEMVSRIVQDAETDRVDKLDRERRFVESLRAKQQRKTEQERQDIARHREYLSLKRSRNDSQ